MTVSDKSLGLMEDLSNATDGYLFTKEPSRRQLVKAGFVEVNKDIKQDDGSLATRLTPAGINYLNSLSKGQSEMSESQTAAFEIESDVAIPKIKRGVAAGSSKYPFNQLEVGQSFHVPATAERPNPEKSMASVTSTANSNWSEPVDPPQTEVIEVTVNKRNPQTGEFLVDENGKRLYERVKKEQPVTRQIRRFICRTVDETDPKGKGARIFRTE